jgi:hypothetical protein
MYYCHRYSVLSSAGYVLDGARHGARYRARHGARMGKAWGTHGARMGRSPCQQLQQGMGIGHGHRAWGKHGAIALPVTTARGTQGARKGHASA